MGGGPAEGRRVQGSRDPIPSLGIHDALFKAYFVDGFNLAQGDRLVEIAERTGLDPEGARQVIVSRSYREAVNRDWERSAELGVTAVPTFVMDGRGVVGAQSYAVLEQLVSQAGALRR